MDDFSLIEQSISHYFPILGLVNGEENEESFFVVGDYNPSNFRELVQELDQYGFVPFINPEGNHYKISIAKKQEKGPSRIHLNIILLLATICSTVFAGYFYISNGNIWEAVEFAAALLLIIGAHELAHYYAARKHGINATLPYFIPAPTFIGTFGALINIKSPIPTRDALFDLGYSGPLAGFLVAVPVLFIGLYYSTLLTTQSAGFMFPDPLIIKIISQIVIPNYTFDSVIVGHPLVFAGWVGMLVTMLNLMPVAFLDGGHIARSLFHQNIHKFISVIGIILTIILGWYFMAVIMVFIFFMGKNHPGALDNVTPISRNRKIMTFLILAIFILSLSFSPNRGF
ncbi:MAG: site-2 protease family protein [Methanobacteriaceae archaeon]|nr:site-2 protease family protein [Methanobacteriaceae archaeon]